MNLSKDSIKILRLADKHESINFEDGCMALHGSVHDMYAPENFTFLKDHGLVVICSEMMPEEYERTTIRITPAGQAELKAYNEQTREKWITRSLSISALIISAISLAWQVLSSIAPE